MTMQAYLSNLASAAPAAAELALKAALWLGAILVINALLRNASAATRHLVWTLGVAGLFVIPFVSNNIPWRIAVPLTVAPDAHRARRGPSVGDTPTDFTPAVGPAVEANTAAAPPLGSLGPSSTVSDNRYIDSEPLRPALFRMGMFVLALWSLGVLALLTRLTASLVRVSRIVGDAWPHDDERLTSMLRALARRVGLRRPVQLLSAQGTAIPFTAGTLRPVIVLPVGAETWSVEKQEAVLLHELAHVARLDVWTSLAAHVACALYWFNPLVWIAARRMRIEGERACDDAVLRFGTRASDYADQLLDVVRETRNRWAPAVAVAMARRSAFEGRLLAILSPDTNRQRLTLRFAVPVTLGVALIALPIAAMRASAPSGTAVVPEETLAEQDTTRAGQTASDSLRAAAPSANRQETVARTAVARTLAGALKDTDERVRVAAIQSITARGERSVLLDLIPMLGDSSVDVRRAAAEAFHHMPDPRAIAALVQALRNDSDPGVRELAAQALAQIDDERAVPGLTEALRQERVVAVRRQIVYALAEIQSPSSAAALGEALRDSDAETRQHAIEGLGSLQVKSVAPQLIPMLRDPNADVRAKAAWALGELKSAEALDELMAAASDANADVRQYAINALSSLEDARAMPAFLRALRDPNVDVRRQAVSAISDVDGLQRAPRELVDALNDEDLEVRGSAIRALGEIKDASTVSAIMPFARGGQTLAIREAAVEALGEFGGPQVEALLLELIKDPDPKIRRLAAQGLGREG